MVFAVGCPPSGTVLLYDLRKYDKAPFATIDVVEQCCGVDMQCLLRGWTKLEFSNDGKSLLLGTNGNGHFLLDAFEGTLKAYLRRPLAAPKGLAPAEPAVAAIGSSGAGSATLDCSANCCYAPDGRIVIGGAGHDVVVWDTLKPPPESKVLEPSWRLQDKREVAAVAFNPRYNFFATSDQDLVFWLPDSHG